MSEAPRQDLRAELHRLEATNSTLLRRNKRLAEILAEARTQLQEIKLAVAHLGDPPNTYGTLIEVAPDKTTAEVVTAGRRMRLPLSPDLVINNQVRVDVRPGAQVRLNEGLVVVDVAGYLNHGEVASVKEVLADERRALVVDKTDEEFVIQLAAPLLPPHSPRPPRVGDIVLLDRRAGFAFEAIPKPEVEELILEEVPDVDYSDIGGLTAQITQIRDAVELPFTHPEAYAKFGLRPPKGVLLYGPPGCGKTLIAKAVANSLATQIAVARGADPSDRKAARSYFLNVKGPELLNKYVGETERQIRLIFERAREKASAGTPVIIFFDEMDSIFRTRGSGVSSDMETTVVPQLLSELDGVEGLENVIVIGASNREEMIDPAILRPGRLDVKIRIDRPDQQAAREIFSKYLTAPLPLRAEDVLGHDTEEAYLAHLIEEVLEAMYTRSAANRFVELTYVDQTTEVLYFADFASGAMIANIVDRAKKHAIKDLIAGAGEGLRLEHLTAAVREEFAENEDLPNSANPDEWARISGRRGDQVVRVKTLTTPRNNQYTAE